MFERLTAFAFGKVRHRSEDGPLFKTRRKTLIFGKACRVFDSQFNHKIFTFCAGLLDGKLCDERRLVFDLDFEIVGLKERRRFFKDREEFAGSEPVVGIILKP